MRFSWFRIAAASWYVVPAVRLLRPFFITDEVPPRWIEVWGLGGQLDHRQPVRVTGGEGTHLPAEVRIEVVPDHGDRASPAGRPGTPTVINQTKTPAFQALSCRVVSR
jgi:hypothetical protein